MDDGWGGSAALCGGFCRNFIVKFAILTMWMILTTRRTAVQSFVIRSSSTHVRRRPDDNSLAMIRSFVSRVVDEPLLTRLTTKRFQPKMEPSQQKRQKQQQRQQKQSVALQKSRVRLVACWSKAGIGTSVVVEYNNNNNNSHGKQQQQQRKNRGARIVLDIGATPIFDETIPSSVVLLSHGHIDHVGALFSHARAYAVAHGGYVAQASERYGV